MNFPKIWLSNSQLLELEAFRQMDNFAINKYELPIVLMMENAGLNLAKLIVSLAHQNSKIVIGVGPGNNGGGGLVCARRLLAWGFKVTIHHPFKKRNNLVNEQLSRAIAYGAMSLKTIPNDPDIFVDSYLGFSQRLPLGEPLSSTVKHINTLSTIKISLDIPTGLGGIYFIDSDHIVTMAAGKKILHDSSVRGKTYIADLGISHKVYRKFNINPIDFSKGTLLEYVVN